MNSALSSSKALSADAIVKVFNDLFRHSYRTCLLGGADEPLYEPARDGTPAQIFFREDYVSSALHEVAHWCIAGAARRTRIDYGYWYDPDGRSEDAQIDFMKAEARPQALEWCFSKASGVPFRLSMDNLDAPPDPAMKQAFANAVLAQAHNFAQRGLPPRAQLMFGELGRCTGARLEAASLRFFEGDLL
ncbi:elongation factor P hydroxylase [Congregibacter variabilis]|uniref:Elongation factor P hydroxylase n=1 Tax=Congregibacter variabilis TaxID=3081200 RepID=A0ABZ0I7H9_9GAMM|nr:elongation factor P hydroxylase [Congregibacter sp. IMCC43200]